MNEPKKVHPSTDSDLIDRIQKFNSDEALIELMNRYLPLVKSMAAKYYAHDMDFDDWKQEAALVLIKVIKRYRQTRQVKFGAYYRSCLKNRFYDFIRKQGAKKRIPNNYVTSYSADRAYYDDILMDTKASHPERSVIITDALRQLMERCSSFERLVLIDTVVKHRSLSTIAKLNHCSITKVRNASERYCHKFRKMRNNGLD